ncbi:glutathione s-transferase [Colletotrichum karsti]|uniref:Glutathione s-transferase n=1 Tax=Colletotrichum karsti TaxID=1095194 RepID=A0A9P6I428_9PEZI|nr:glutathione s-transferase [Colletotrichum karsti]KAF9876567.1 glutathione s-transferase [Colletotrichum karsti]
MPEQLILFDIPDKNGVTWSLNPWKARLALNYKGIDYKTEWLEYPDIEPRLKPTGLEGDPEQIKPYTCPAVQFPDGTYVMNSKKIIKRLEEEYPEKPLNADSELTQAVLDVASPLFDALAPMLLHAVQSKLLSERSAKYFWDTRKEFLNMTLPEFEEKYGGEKAWERAKKPLDESAALLNKTEGPFFHGQDVSYADFIFVGFLDFAKKCDEDIYARIIQASNSFDVLYKACGPWLKRRDS